MSGSCKGGHNGFVVKVVGFELPVGKATHCGGCYDWSFGGVAVGVAHGGFGGHGGSMARCHGSCGVHSEHKLVCCDVVLAPWMKHGGRMRGGKGRGWW